MEKCTDNGGGRGAIRQDFRITTVWVSYRRNERLCSFVFEESFKRSTRLQTIVRCYLISEVQRVTGGIESLSETNVESDYCKKRDRSASYSNHIISVIRKPFTEWISFISAKIIVRPLWIFLLFAKLFYTYLHDIIEYRHIERFDGYMFKLFYEILLFLEFQHVFLRKPILFKPFFFFKKRILK